MSFKVRTFKVIKLNKYLGIVMMLAFLSTILVSLKLAYEQEDNLTVNKTSRLAQNKTEIYGDTLMDVRKNANITIPSDLHQNMDKLE